MPKRATDGDEQYLRIAAGLEDVRSGLPLGDEETMHIPVTL